jgi:hypothetical protein
MLTAKEVELLTTKHYWPQLKPIVLSIKTRLLNPTPYPLIINSDFLLCCNNAKSYWRTQFKLTGRCVICGSKESIQMLPTVHIRHINGYQEKTKEAFHKIMGLLNRKQIPLCKEHHRQIHLGK